MDLQTGTPGRAAKVSQQTALEWKCEPVPVPRRSLMGREGRGKDAVGGCQILPTKETATFLMATRDLNFPDSSLTCLSYSSWLPFHTDNLDGQG